MVFVLTRGIRSIRVSVEERSCVEMCVHSEKVREQAGDDPERKL